MDPYEKTAQEMKRQAEGPKRFAKTALGIGASVAASSFAPILTRAAPFLSQYIPEDLAIKGLSKINPKFGKFIQDAFNGGYDFQEAKDFIGDQVNQSQSAKETQNIIQQYDPELHTYISDYLKKGVPLLEAGKRALGHGRFRKAIDKLIKDHKASWDSILRTVYGNEGLAQPQQQEQQAMQQPGQEQSQQGNPQAKQQLLQAMQALSQQLRT